MAETLMRATFYIPGDVTFQAFREALIPLECRYNLSAWLAVDRDFTEYQSAAEYLTFVFPRVARRRRNSSDFNDLATYAQMSDLITNSVMRDHQYAVLRINSVLPAGSVSVDTSGLGDPLKEVVSKVWSRKERQEARRHQEQMNRREERDSDQEYRQRERENLFDNIERIEELRKSGAIRGSTAQALIRDLLPFQSGLDLALQVDNPIEYVDDSLKEIEQ